MREPKVTRRQALAAVIGCAGALLLAGCGFQPLYGTNSVSASAATQLSQVRIRPIANRTGQLLYNKLRDRLNPGGKPADPAFILEVQLEERQERLLVERDETTSRINFILRANYELKQYGTGTVVDSGVAQTTISYDLLGSQYQFSTVTSEKDVRDRAAEQLSEDISTRLAIYFSALNEAS